MSDQTQRANTTDASLRDALQALLDEGLDGAELLYRVRLLLPMQGEAAAEPAPEEAASHPGQR